MLPQQEEKPLSERDPLGLSLSYRRALSNQFANHVFVEKQMLTLPALSLRSLVPSFDALPAANPSVCSPSWSYETFQQSMVVLLKRALRARSRVSSMDATLTRAGAVIDVEFAVGLKPLAIPAIAAAWLTAVGSSGIEILVEPVVTSQWIAMGLSGYVIPTYAIDRCITRAETVLEDKTWIPLATMRLQLLAVHTQERSLPLLQVHCHASLPGNHLTLSPCVGNGEGVFQTISNCWTLPRGPLRRVPLSPLHSRGGVASHACSRRIVCFVHNVSRLAIDENTHDAHVSNEI